MSKGMGVAWLSVHLPSWRLPSLWHALLNQLVFP